MTDTGGSSGPVVFRPRRGRVVPLVMATIALVVAAVQPAVLRVLSLSGFASIIKLFDDVGLAVRNLLITRTVSWEEIVEVRFPDGAPWVSLELTDTDELAVMAIQRADGDDAKVEARRLAELVAERRTTR